jgi:hypothetical protein
LQDNADSAANELSPRGVFAWIVHYVFLFGICPNGLWMEWMTHLPNDDEMCTSDAEIKENDRCIKLACDGRHPQ